MSELKACPFCGGEPKHERCGPSNGIYAVSCGKCQLSWLTPTLWNRRPTEQSLRAEVERLRGELKIQDDANEILTRQIADVTRERDDAVREREAVHWCWDKAMLAMGYPDPQKMNPGIIGAAEKIAAERDALAARAGELEKDKARLDWLNKEAGYFQDDSATKVEISPDDATCTWHIQIGKTKAYARSIRGAIDAAMKEAE